MSRSNRSDLLEPGDSPEKTLEINRCYSISKLTEWLKHDTWASHEALCLVCDIEPSDSEILWPPRFEDISFDTPQPQRIAMLSEEPIYSLAPDPDADTFALQRSNSFIEERLETGWDTEFSCHFFEIHTRMQNRQRASGRLESCWRIFFSTPAHADLPPQEPTYFLEWSSRKQIEIPWLEWAKSSGLINDKPDESPAVKTEKRTIPSKASEIEELREAAIQIAITHHINDGMPKKNITVRKICTWLIDSGEFSSGEPFSTRWREVEGMRALLKRPHNPLSDKRYLAAKPIKSPKFNP